MASGSSSSIWRSLAVAFGDGLAFGVGVKLSQNAARPARSTASPEQSLARIAPPSNPASEPRAGLDQKVLQSILNALDARLQEHASQIDRRVTELDARFALELRDLDQQDRSIAAKVTQDLNTLEGQIVSINREFGQAVARIVAEQVAVQVRQQVADYAATADRALDRRIADSVDAALEQRVSIAVRSRLESLDRRLAEADAVLDQRIAQTLADRLAPLENQFRQELVRKDQEIAGLRQQLADADTHLLDLISGIGQVCRRAAERIASAPAAAATPQPEPAAPVEPPVAEPEGAGDLSAEPPIPGFAQPHKPTRPWRVPLVSSLVMLASGGLLLIRYL